VGLGVSALAVYLLLQQVPVPALLAVLAEASPPGMLLVAGTVAGSLLTRVARWRVLFRPAQDVPFRPLLETLAISYMVSTFLPFRAGEVVRAVLLSTRAGVPVPRVIGTILVEKLFDFLAIGVLLLALLVAIPMPREAFAAGASIVLVILGGFGFVVALALWRGPTIAAVAWVERHVPGGLGARLGLARAATQFAQGTDSLRVPRLWLPLLGWTACTWAFSVVTAVGGSLAVGANASLAALVFLTVLTSTGQAVPSSPGYVGVYHAAAVLALSAFGVDTTRALAMAVLTHALSYGSLVLMGIVALWLGGYAAGDLWSAARGRGAATTAGSAAPAAPRS
jgi:uncharacterized protein (TIRG00374 family)